MKRADCLPVPGESVSSLSCKQKEASSYDSAIMAVLCPPLWDPLATATERTPARIPETSEVPR
jgi:hypothetical protein